MVGPAAKDGRRQELEWGFQTYASGGHSPTNRQGGYHRRRRLIVKSGAIVAEIPIPEGDPRHSKPMPAEGGCR